MTIQRTALDVRAATHAALADTLRLRIVDLLMLGDLSVGELRRELGASAPLVSHHLGVLERAGIVSQLRAESDRRRRYVRVHPEALATSWSAPAVAAPRVLFVCSGNSARSPIAAALWNRVSPVPGVSAGTRPAAAVADQAVSVSAAHGVDIAGHVPVAVSQVARPGDFVVTVCDRAREVVTTGFDLHWSVPNPGTAGSRAAYEATFDDLADRVARVAPHVTAAAQRGRPTASR